jgi:hypothetical protein
MPRPRDVAPTNELYSRFVWSRDCMPRPRDVCGAMCTQR